MKNKIVSLTTILKNPHTKYERFHSQTAIINSHLHKIDPGRVYFKAYDRFSAIQVEKKGLPKTLKKTLICRSSQRGVNSNSKITFKQIGSLLYYSAGMKQYKSQVGSYRFYPSAGGRYPIETYLIANRVEGLASGGIYHYNVKGNYLEEHLPIKKDLSLFKRCFQQPFVHKSDAVIVLTGIFKRTTIKYGERGYRYVLMECGHVGQNIYLVGPSLKVGVCGICGFYDKILNDYLHIDGVSESALYCFSLNTSHLL